MPHNIDLILTLTGGLTAALVLGFITQKLKLSPIVGYLLAGVVVGPYTPGFVGDKGLSEQFAEIGVILLMFGVGLHFHLKDLMAVRRVAVPGAVVQIAVATALGAGVTHFFGWSWTAGMVFGMAISVASTVVLTRVLSDNRALHTPTGHIAIGWLIVEDLFTILALVLLPAIFVTGANASGGGAGVWMTLGISLIKLTLLVVFTLVAGQKIIPWFLGYVARTGSRDLFTLAVLSLALGIAVGSVKFFGASMPLGAFLAGMVVGQSEFSARAASDALPMRDAFAVLFFVSVGMQFDPGALREGWPLMLATTGIVIIGKPLAALLVVLAFKKPIASALAISVALAQIGEFSFILGALAVNTLKIMPPEAIHAMVFAAVVSITLNPLLYKGIAPLTRWLQSKGYAKVATPADVEGGPVLDEEKHHAIVVGYGPVGQTLCRILDDNNIQPVILEMNIETVRKLRAEGLHAVYGDATSREILHHAGIETAQGLIIAASNLPVHEVVQVAREMKPDIRILLRTTYLKEAKALDDEGIRVFSGEGEIALSMTAHLMHELGATDEQIDRERGRVRAELF
ncbi:sodium:proton exchanger [Phragmitibacter flavus]|uniref:Sodium:proton exchanger n=1 Tax=Phragmitibacter flavus TaxID=2576071 RepID=A0A5R8KFY0_9BACT|nr:cation:proton antiporter [Phragmitibacter flavus]TLD71222.1 sodium:proton exchanger [Phragmitibacter flavus]